MPDIDSFSVSQLRSYLKEAGADTSGCFEKVRGALTGSDLTGRKKMRKHKTKEKSEQRGAVQRHSAGTSRRLSDPTPRRALLVRGADSVRRHVVRTLERDDVIV